jgi:hypothetical protein
MFDYELKQLGEDYEMVLLSKQTGKNLVNFVETTFQCLQNNSEKFLSESVSLTVKRLIRG